MSGTELLPTPQSYSDIAAIHGRRLLLYREFGSYQGEWLMLAAKDDEYALYKGWYGSCSGCDDIQATWDYSDQGQDAEKVRKWADDYRPFALIPRQTAINLVNGRTLGTVFPGNIRDGGDVNVDEFVEESELIIALEEDLPLSHEDATRSRNQETRRRIFERVGIAGAISEVLAIEENGPDRLVKLIDDGTYLHLHDGSTDREYLLRVPPETKSVRHGKAWSFNVPVNTYKPTIET